jgi:hypothetical protein
MGKGCLSMLLSLTFLGIIVSAVVLFVMFGPSNPLIGFAFGAGIVAVMLGLSFKFPVLTTSAKVREVSAMGVFARLAAYLVNTSSDPRGNGLRATRIIFWLWFLLVGALALLMAVIVLGMYMQGKEPANITHAAMLCGFFSATTVFLWKSLSELNRHE